MNVIHYRKLLVAAAVLTASVAQTYIAHANDTDYEPPAGYYNSAAGLTGSALKSQLSSIMNANLRRITYGNVRYAFAITDKDPNNSNNILLIYNRESVSSTWDNGATYDREHQWPQSLIGASASNGVANVASDLFMLRPCKPNINSSRNNSPYGRTTSSGTYGYQTPGYFYPGNADAGDVARAMFYAATTYSNLSLVDNQPGALQMGDLDSLVKWHYQDTPDSFERRRNQTIYSSTLNPNYYQGNRNAYIDRPEYVWSVFVDQQNDTRLTVDKTSVNLGSVFVGGSLGTQTVTINKAGVDGTYYSVTTAGSATSTVTGRYNAFAMDQTGTKSMTVGLNAPTSSAGLKSGTITVDNLDVTTQGGAGRGANDENDVVNVTATVLDHAKASLDANTVTNSITLNFGMVDQNSTGNSESFSLFNLVQTADFTAMLDLDNIVFTGDQGVFSSDLAAVKDITAGTGREFFISISTLNVGTFSGMYSLTTSDQDLAGALTYSPLTVYVTGTVTAVPEPATAALFVGLLGAGLLVRSRHRKA